MSGRNLSATACIGRLGWVGLSIGTGIGYKPAARNWKYTFDASNT